MNLDRTKFAILVPIGERQHSARYDIVADDAFEAVAEAWAKACKAHKPTITLVNTEDHYHEFNVNGETVLAYWQEGS